MPTRRDFLAAGAGVAATAAGLGTVASSRAHGDGPNVLVVVIDTLRMDHAYGAAAKTPTIDALSAEGLRFDRAFPEAMPTVPVRNAILSGRRMFPFRDWEDERGLLDKPGWAALADPSRAFTSVLRRAGWWTAYVTDNPFLGFSQPYEPLRHSFDLFVRRSGQIGGRSGGGAPEDLLAHWLHPATRDTGTVNRVSRYIANSDYSNNETESFAARVFSSAVGALDRAARRPPFALVVDSFHPHEPWTPPAAYLELNGHPPGDGPEPAMPRYGRVDSWLTEEEAGPVLERMGALYAAEVSLTDRWLGTLIERLHDHGLERCTVIALVGDHGFQLGERGWTGKISSALHPELIQVPLIVVDPERRRAGERCSYYASTHDLARTLLGIAGVRPPHGVHGVDLGGFFGGREPPERPYAYGGYSNHHYLRSERWAYMSDNRQQAPRLFDLECDPGESENVAASNPDVVDELSQAVRGGAGGALPYYDS
ncbi:MAG: sulfatase family protein [Thermoleophilaceae bacterium]